MNSPFNWKAQPSALATKLKATLKQDNKGWRNDAGKLKPVSKKAVATEKSRRELV